MDPGVPALRQRQRHPSGNSRKSYRSGRDMLLNGLSAQISRWTS
jgi:hypothetical protein